MWYPIVVDDAAANGDFLEAMTDDGAQRAIRCDTPPCAADLDQWLQHSFSLDANLAAELNIPFGFSGSANGRQRVFVLESSRSKECTAADGATMVRYGVAVRLAVKASNLSAEMNLSLPLLAAETQIGRAQTESTLLVNGYVGTDLAPLLPKPGLFDVEKYAELMDAIGKIQELINREVTNIRPVPLQVAPRQGQEPDLVDQALGTVWALSRMADGDSLQQATRDFPMPHRRGALMAIESTYAEASGGQAAGGLTLGPAAWADSRLEGLRLRRPWWL